MGHPRGLEGVRQWEAMASLEFVERSGRPAPIEFYAVFAITDHARGSVDVFTEPLPAVR